jgi:hypothetical protein
VWWKRLTSVSENEDREPKLNIGETFICHNVRIVGVSVWKATKRCPIYKNIKRKKLYISCVKILMVRNYISFAYCISYWLCYWAFGSGFNNKSKMHLKAKCFLILIKLCNFCHPYFYVTFTLNLRYVINFS